MTHSHAVARRRSGAASRRRAAHVVTTVIATDDLVACDDVARTFGRGATAVVAVHGMTCHIRAGDVIALTGPSGSGKSTALHLLAGLDEPTTGSITWPAIGDRNALRPGPVSMVFQGPSLMPSLDVLENVALPLVLAGRSDQEARSAADDALNRLSLLGLRERLPDQLSAGQAQRVAVARALAGAPVLLLADEPTGQLDRANATLVVDALITTAAATGAALIVATHDARSRVDWRSAGPWQTDASCKAIDAQPDLGAWRDRPAPRAISRRGDRHRDRRRARRCHRLVPRCGQAHDDRLVRWNTSPSTGRSKRNPERIRRPRSTPFDRSLAWPMPFRSTSPRRRG